MRVRARARARARARVRVYTRTRTVTVDGPPSGDEKQNARGTASARNGAAGTQRRGVARTASWSLLHAPLPPPAVAGVKIPTKLTRFRVHVGFVRILILRRQSRALKFQRNSHAFAFTRRICANTHPHALRVSPRPSQRCSVITLPIRASETMKEVPIFVAICTLTAASFEKAMCW